MPGAWISLINTELDWGYHTVPQRRCFGRRLVWPRGKLVGGSGAINALIYMRGEAADYDRWQAKGAEGWGWQDVLPIFKRQERNARLGGSPMHGDSGELLVNDVPEHDPAEHLWVKAAEEAGLPRNDDFNSGDQFGCGFFQAMIKDGERFGPADAFLDPVLDRPNLTLVTSALATRILIENGRAQGVEYFRHGKVETAPAGEIVLAGGTVNSPHLLFLSGIGPADALKQAGVSPVHDLPGVGQSMQDHVNVVVTYATDQKIGIGGLVGGGVRRGDRRVGGAPHGADGQSVVVDRRPGEVAAGARKAGPADLWRGQREPRPRPLLRVPARHRVLHDPPAAEEHRHADAPLARSADRPGDRSGLFLRSGGRRPEDADRRRAPQPPDRRDEGARASRSPRDHALGGGADATTRSASSCAATASRSTTRPAPAGWAAIRSRWSTRNR